MTKQSPLAKRILAVRNAKNASFTQLVSLAGLDRRRAFRFANLAGVDLSNQDLNGFDFTGANLQGANLDGAKLEGAILEGALFEGDGRVHDDELFRLAEQLPFFSLAQITKLLRSKNFDEGVQIYALIEKARRGHPRLLAELIARSDSEQQGLAVLRNFFQLNWHGPKAKPIIRSMLQVDWTRKALLEAIDFTSFVPASSTQLMLLLGSAHSFDVANLLYKHFERFCTTDHLVALGSFSKSPEDYSYLYKLAERFSSGLDRALLAMRALPTAEMVKIASRTLVDIEVEHSPQLLVILAGKAQRAKEVLLLLQDAREDDRLALRILAASLQRLDADEAFQLLRTVTLEGAPISLDKLPNKKVVDLLIALYQKRKHVSWRTSVFREFLQWRIHPHDLDAPQHRKTLRFADRVEIACMLTAVHSFDLEQTLLPSVSSEKEYQLLQCGLRTVRPSRDTHTTILEELRSLYRTLQRQQVKEARAHDGHRSASGEGQR